MYYDRQGQPITLAENNAAWERGDKTVAEDTLPDGKWVSTVWIGLDPGGHAGPSHIFETMVFRSRDNLSDLECRRYPTESAALAGHRETVERWSKDPMDPGDA